MAYPLYPSILPFLFFSFFFFLAPMIPIRDTCGDNEINRELQFILHAEWWNFYSTFLCKTRVRHKRTNRWDGIRISTIISSSVSTGLFYLSVYPRIESFTFLFFFFLHIPRWKAYESESKRDRRKWFPFSFAFIAKKNFFPGNCLGRNQLIRPCVPLSRNIKNTNDKTKESRQTLSLRVFPDNPVYRTPEGRKNRPLLIITNFYLLSMQIITA